MKQAARHRFCLPPRTRARGFSLVQLMVTVAIVAILTGISIPSYKYITNSSRIANEINGLLGDLQYARFAALKTGQPVTICSSANPAQRPSPTCAASINWAQGWIMFNDTAGTGQYVAGEGILRDQLAFSGTDTLVGGISGITFNREGFPVTTVSAANTADVLLTLHAAPSNTQSTRCINVGLNGQVLTEKSGTGACL